MRILIIAIALLLPAFATAAWLNGDFQLRDAIYLYGQPLDARGSKALVGVNCDVLQLVLDVESGFVDLAIGESASSAADALVLQSAYPDRIEAAAAMFAYAITSNRAYKTFQFRDVRNASAGTVVGSGTVFGYCFATMPGAYVYLQSLDTCTIRLSNGDTQALSGCTPSSGTPTPAPPAQPTLVTPFVSSLDIRSVTPFSAGANSPWGWPHDGIDFMPAGNGKPFRAPLSGLVEDVILWSLPNPNLANAALWQVNVIVKHDDTYRYAYAFETFSPHQADGQTQRNMIAVTKGQFVAQGDIIGSSYMADPTVQVTVHFSFIKNGISICSEPYFAQDARDAILQLIRKDHPDWVFCFP